MRYLVFSGVSVSQSDCFEKIENFNFEFLIWRLVTNYVRLRNWNNKCSRIQRTCNLVQLILENSLRMRKRISWWNTNNLSWKPSGQCFDCLMHFFFWLICNHVSIKTRHLHILLKSIFNRKTCKLTAGN